MRPGSFLGLAAATVIGIAAGSGAVIYQSRVSGHTQVMDEPMFPELVVRANEVTRVSYRTPGGDATIDLIDGEWVFTEKHNFPVRAGNVRSVVASVAALRRLEPKTDNPELYPRLQVEGVDAEDGRSREVILEAGGDVLAAVIVGRPGEIMRFDPLGGIYLREIGEDQAWLARGTIPLPPTPLDLMERQVVHVPGPDIREIQIWEGDESVLHAEKLADDAGVLRYVLMPPSDTVRAIDGLVKQLAAGVVSLRFEDVLPADGIEFPEGAREVAFHTYDGMELRVRVTLRGEEGEEQAWATFAATADEGAEDAERAQTINEATNGWAFRLASHKRAALTRAAADLIEPIPEPGEVAPGPVLPGGLGLPVGPLGRPALPGSGR